ncbi:MAG: tRNA guanosine(34) transglycosylase Tgt [Clostridiales bacterium]|nr:tRNA guanosine(34) transglycosylase Tgt [Clostridiales bacterium]
MSNFRLIATEGSARRGVLSTVHGDIQTPVFMNVGTSAAIKGGVSTFDLREINCQVELSNTYHLHVRPGEDVVYALGGIHRFFNWDKPVLTDSGGFQVFSLAHLRNIREEGVTFQSHMDGAKIFMSPETSMYIQSRLASTIAMAFDECPSSVAERSYIRQSCDRTVRWLYRCRDELNRLNGLEETINRSQLLFGINQGGVYTDIRREHMERIRELDLPGYAIGGLAVGEKTEVMYEVISQVEQYMPSDRPRYLMGVGTPVNILESVARGIDFFDCVMPSRNARHGNLFTSQGLMNLNNNKYLTDDRPIDPNCGCEVCRRYSRAYIRHLFKARELLGMRLCVLHNLYFYNDLMRQIREHIEDGSFTEWKNRQIPVLGGRAE